MYTKCITLIFNCKLSRPVFYEYHVSNLITMANYLNWLYNLSRFSQGDCTSMAKALFQIVRSFKPNRCNKQ